MHGDVAADNLFVVMIQKIQHRSSFKVSGQLQIQQLSLPLIFSQMIWFVSVPLNSVEFCVFTIIIDPTFLLGDFDVTPITYSHMLLETRRGKSHPIFLGPMLIHYRKTFGTYLFFASTLVGLSQQLQGVRAFGTDGEKAIADAFMHEFTYSQRLTCFIHVK